jgi:hypothetical protein
VRLLPFLRAPEDISWGGTFQWASPHSEGNHQGHPAKTDRRGQPQHGIWQELGTMGSGNHHPRRTRRIEALGCRDRSKMELDA